jgi:hypothetical protein
VLSSQEERAWDDIQRHWSQEVEEPPRPVRSRTTRAPQADPPVAAHIGARVTIILLLLGAAPAALAVAVATAVVWVMARSRPQRGGQDALITSPETAGDTALQELAVNP